jgi:hypothetical protein
MGSTISTFEKNVLLGFHLRKLFGKLVGKHASGEKKRKEV